MYYHTHARYIDPTPGPWTPFGLAPSFQLGAWVRSMDGSHARIVRILWTHQSDGTWFQMIDLDRADVPPNVNPFV